MNKFLGFLTKAKAVMFDPMILYTFAIQMIVQYQAANYGLAVNGILAGLVLSFALALAHVIPAYSVYVVGEGSGLGKAPGLKSKVTFMLLGTILAFVFSATFTYGVLGVACQPFLPLVANPTVSSIGMTGLLAAGLGSVYDVIAISAILAHGGWGDK